MAYHVALVEINDRYPRNVLQGLQRFDNAGAFVRRQIDLGHIAGNHAFGTRTDAREQHEHLLHGRVLRFIENHERVVQSATAHISERRYFDCLPRNRTLDLARQKSKRFARFHRRSTQNNSTDLVLLQRGHGHCDREISFPGAGWSDPENDVVFVDRLHVIPLPGGTRDDWRLAGRSRDFHRDRVGEIVTARFTHRAERVLKFVFLNRDALLLRFLELIEYALRLVDFLRLTLEFYPAFPSGDFHAERIFHVFQKPEIVRVKR